MDAITRSAVVFFVTLGGEFTTANVGDAVRFADM
jgi:hypothetical protein